MECGQSSAAFYVSYQRAPLPRSRLEFARAAFGVRSHFRCRQVEPKAGAGADIGFKPDLAAHALDAFADQGQTNSSARIAIMGMEPLEQPENFVMKLRRDA